MLHFVWWFFFGYLGFGWGNSKMDVDGCDSLCSHCSAWLGKWMVLCFADFMGAVRCCLLLKKLRMSRNDRVPMLPVALVAVNHVSFPCKKPSKTIQDRQFCRIWYNMQIRRTFPCWVCHVCPWFPTRTSNDFFGGRPPNPAALLVRQEDVFAQQWFSLWRRQAG